MVLFLQIISLVCVAALLISYGAYRRALRPENRARKSDAQLRREARIYTAVMIVSVAVVVAATLILRKFM